MTDWELSALRSRTQPKPATFLQQRARQALFHALQSLTSGRIAVREGEACREFGTGSETAEITVFDPRFYTAVVRGGAIGAAESYSRGEWESDNLTRLFRIFVRRIGHESSLERAVAWLGSFPAYVGHMLRRNGRLNSRRNIEAHYDLGNDFFRLFLDPSMTYSSGIFTSAGATLHDASIAKLRQIGRKLDLASGMHVLEIGCGWGSFAIQTARDYNVKVTGVTLSPSQHREALRRVKDAGLQDRVEILLKDYRDLHGSFDRIASIEMVEAIGNHRLPEFFGTADRLLAADGVLVMQAITMPDQGYRQYLRRTDVIRHLIFPGSCCPARTALLNAAAASSTLRCMELEEIGPHYAATLGHWRRNLVANFDAALKLGYSPELLRLWHLYLCYCEAGFAEGHVGDVQITFAKPGYLALHAARTVDILSSQQCSKAVIRTHSAQTRPVASNGEQEG
jgi:cyclopropane-fatty-acyl-phospholipid synthase